MSKTPGFSQGIDMPSRKKQSPAAIDLMRPGNGTPWEDRGSTGAVSAYFKTVGKTFTSPALLLDHLRRPDTTNDARAFAIVCGAMWVIGILLYNIYWLYFQLPKLTDIWEPDVNMTYYWLTTALQAGCVAGGVFLWLKVGTRMFQSLGENELKGATPALVYNCFAYGLGPSLLAVIPVLGWIVAPLWIVFNLMVAARRRLYMRATSAIINPILIGVSALGVAVAVYLLGVFVWSNPIILNMSGLERHVVQEAPKIPGRVQEGR